MALNNTADHVLEPCQLAARLLISRGQGGATIRLGWDMKSAEQSSAGRRMSEGTFGHLGFTGTSLWLEGPRGTDSRSLAEAAAARSVIIEPGDRFFGPTTLNKAWMEQDRPIVWAASAASPRPSSKVPPL